ncbi:hypothetical protein GW17_00038992 [Ensete ventricosum]|nr:hypothetical protein GW17_00038992 [Ensete ventricosum]
MGKKPRDETLGGGEVVMAPARLSSPRKAKNSKVKQARRGLGETSIPRWGVESAWQRRQWQPEMGRLKNIPPSPPPHHPPPHGHNSPQQANK